MNFTIVCLILYGIMFMKKKYDRVIEKPKTDKEKNIANYSKELKKVVDANHKTLQDSYSDVRSLIWETEDKFDVLNGKLYKAKSVSIEGINQIESNLDKVKYYLLGE